MDPHATAGRVVHYYPIDGNQNPIAAHVNRETTKDGQAQLTILEASGPRVIQRVMYSESPAPGCWTWMEYQRAKAEATGGNQSEEEMKALLNQVDELVLRVAELEGANSDFGEPETETPPPTLDLKAGIKTPAPLTNQAGEPIWEGADKVPPLVNQAGEEIHGDEEVPNAAPVDLSSAADNG